MSDTKRNRKRRKPSSPHVPQFNGDHGQNTLAAKIGTVVEPIVETDGSNPNQMARRRRVEAVDYFKLSMRQEQAAKAIRNAYCRAEMLSSGGPLKEKVQSSSRPDAAVASQIEVQAELTFVMSGVPNACRRVVEHVCWHNLSAHSLRPGNEVTNRALFKVAMDKVADALKF